MSKKNLPNYRLHKATKQAFVVLLCHDGVRRSRYLGRHGTPESRKEYDHLIAIYTANGRNRRKKFPKKSPGAQYSIGSYAGAIETACKKAGVERWTPNQLRHLSLSLSRSKSGLDAAQALAGHKNACTTEIYAKVAITTAIRAAKELSKEIERAVDKSL